LNEREKRSILYILSFIEEDKSGVGYSLVAYTLSLQI